MALNCWHCGTKVEVKERVGVGFRDACPSCDRPVHVCLNCGFYDPAYNNSCREPMAERVVDKDRANFCEYFTAGPGVSGSSKPIAAKSEAQKKLEDLFKKKP
jgi:hypothetical protein